MAVTLTTKLEAVNVILSVMAEQPVTALSENADADSAETILDEVSRRVQSSGWRFNTITEDYTADGSGIVTLPTNTAKFDWPRSCPLDPDLVIRVNSGAVEVYDVLNNTGTFTVGKVFKDCTVVQLLDFDELPESMRQYVMISAARQQQDRTIGSSGRARFTRQDEVEAMSLLKRDEAQTGDYNIFDSHVPNIIRRRRPPLNYYTY